MRFLSARLTNGIVTLIVAGLALGLSACSTIGTVSRAEALRIAETYRSHLWTATERNRYHGLDPDGIPVNTPDHTWRAGEKGAGYWIPNQVNKGIPYQWGGFVSIDDFERGLRQGKAAGDVYTAFKREHLRAAVSRYAVGIDCSGLISRCWRLGRHYSTRELPSLCKPIRFADLKPGDIINAHNHHVVLFAAWYDPRREWLLAYQSGTESSHKVVLSLIESSDFTSPGSGYVPLRYKRIRD